MKRILETAGTRAALALTAAALIAAPTIARAQSDLLNGALQEKAPPSPSGTTVIERAGAAKSAAAPGVKLVALLTADGQLIDQGVVWRIYLQNDHGGKSKLVSEVRQPTPQVPLKPGAYLINAAFGRANLTKKVNVSPAEPQTVQFVLNAGGLRVYPTIGGKPAPAGAVSYAIFAEDRDQSSDRTAVMSVAKPNLIIRLNAGIYRIVSTYGDANARVETDVTVEAGKLTEATIAHRAGRASFKLVARADGEAIPDTDWTVQTASGELVKESIGALPSHYLAPGEYLVAARAGGALYTRTFSVTDGGSTTVEVVKDGAGAEPNAERTAPGAAPNGAADTPLGIAP